MATVAAAVPPGTPRPGGWAVRNQAAQLLSASGGTTLVGEAVIHGAAMPAHLREWWLAGAFFALLSLVEVAAALALVVRPSRRLWLTIGVGSLATMVVWAVSRVWGMPVGPRAFRPEAIGVPDYISTCLEAATVVLSGVAVTATRRPRQEPGAAPGVRQGRGLLAAAIVEVAVVTSVATTIAVWADVQRPMPMAPRRVPLARTSLTRAAP